jgi:hypothetical protein
LDFYDLAYAEAINGVSSQMLGFKKILSVDRDINASRDPAKSSGCIYIGSGEGIERASKAGAKAVAPEDYRLEPKAAAHMLDKGTILCISTYPIMSTSGIKRSKRIHFAGNMLDLCDKKGIDVAFVTIARSSLYLCSAMQLIALAELIGADESQARDSIGRVNMRLLE